MSQTEPHKAPEPHKAIAKTGWWPGWIWSIPVAALGLVIWLAFRSWSQAGPEVQVIFPEVANLKPGDTKVQFEGMDVGEVEDSHLAPDLRHIRVTLRLNPDMADHLGPDTAFWIIGKQLNLAHLSDLKAVITGVSIGISPKPGHQGNVYQGRAEAPVLGFGANGTTLRLHAPDLGSLQRGTPIYYLGQQVGQVVSQKMIDARGFDITAFIDAPYDRFVHDGSRFWRAGPLHLSTGGDGPSVRFQSVPALFEGAIAFETPQGDTGAAGHDFPLYASQDEAENAPDSRSVAYRVVFHDASGVPDKHAPVKLMGKRVGTVGDSKLRYDPAQGRMSVIATIMLDPDRIALPDGLGWNNPRAQMDDMMRHLIAGGLHAELSASPPVVGGQLVSLRLAAGPAGTLGDGPVPEIPTLQGGDVAGILAGVSDVVTTVKQMPLSRIADNLHEVSQHIAGLTASPELTDTLHHIDRATANLQRVSEEARMQLPPALANLRRTVTEAQASLASANNLLSAKGSTASGPGTEGLPETLYEISRTARSLRGLSDMLNEHPQALLTGRAGGQ